MFPSSGIGVAGSCEPWVAWVAFNALLHTGWVSTLLACQLYQVNHSSYHFPFNKRTITFISITITFIYHFSIYHFSFFQFITFLFFINHFSIFQELSLFNHILAITFPSIRVLAKIKFGSQAARDQLVTFSRKLLLFFLLKFIDGGKA